VTALLLLVTRYKLLYSDWRGFLISGLSLIWMANIYMSLFFLIRTDLKIDGLKSKIKESELKKCEESAGMPDAHQAVHRSPSTKETI
jgi:hypothetical protein